MLFGLFGKKEKREEILAGEVIHYFRKVKAAVIKVEKEPLSVGDEIVIKRSGKSFRQRIKSMQVNHVPVDKAAKGEEVAIQVSRTARPGSKVYSLK
ncbi:MAG: hypothetical protein ABIG55_06785 [Candidatus Omnitrophota bacterium]|nr:hypothetical protein [Candidatus Omnitrophota bacterium]